MICGAFIDFELLILNQINSIACRIFKKGTHKIVIVYELTLCDLMLPIDIEYVVMYWVFPTFLFRVILNMYNET